LRASMQCRRRTRCEARRDFRNTLTRRWEADSEAADSQVADSTEVAASPDAANI